MLSTPDFNQKQIVFLMPSRGEKLSFKNDNIIIADGDGNVKHQSTCYRLFVVFVVGHLTVTSGLLDRANKFGFSIYFLTENFRNYGAWTSKTQGNVLLRKKQYLYNDFEIANYIVQNKISNQCNAIKNIRSLTVAQKNAIEQLRGYLNCLEQQKFDLYELLGIEGVASRVYFSAIFADCNWTARRPRVKHYTINCLLDIGYTMLFNFVEALLDCYGFDVYKGVYHQQFYQRKSLVCDIVEPFRPIIDARLRKAYRLNQINEKDFYVTKGKYSLFGKNAKPYIKWIMETILENKIEVFLYIQSYYRAFMKDLPIEQFPIFKYKG